MVEIVDGAIVRLMALNPSNRVALFDSYHGGYGLILGGGVYVFSGMRLYVLVVVGVHEVKLNNELPPLPQFAVWRRLTAVPADDGLAKRVGQHLLGRISRSIPIHSWTTTLILECRRQIIRNILMAHLVFGCPSGFYQVTSYQFLAAADRN